MPSRSRGSENSTSTRAVRDAEEFPVSPGRALCEGVSESDEKMSLGGNWSSWVESF